MAQAVESLLCLSSNSNSTKKSKEREREKEKKEGKNEGKKGGFAQLKGSICESSFSYA
jgi:hypothetical protein